MVASFDGYLLLISLLPAQLFCQKIHKYPDFRADGIVAVIDGMERLGHVQSAAGQQFAQATASNIRSDCEIRQAGDTVAREAQLADGFATVGDEMRHGGIRCVTRVGKWLVVQRFRLGEADKRVLRQISHRLRCAAAGEIVGGCHEFQLRDRKSVV